MAAAREVLDLGEGLVTRAVARRPDDAQIVRAQPRHVPEQVCRQPGMLGKPSREWRSQAGAAQLHAAAAEQGLDLALRNAADVMIPRVVEEEVGPEDQARRLEDG